MSSENFDKKLLCFHCFKTSNGIRVSPISDSLKKNNFIINYSCMNIKVSWKVLTCMVAHFTILKNGQVI